MKTHPDSVWIDCDDHRRGVGTFTHCELKSTDLELVPASAYIELKNELTAANTQLQTQTENMLALRKFVETIADKPHFGELPADIVEQAQDLISRITR